MDLEIVFRQGLLGLSVLACGTLVYLAQTRVIEWWSAGRSGGKDYLGHAMVDLGTAMIIFAIVQSILLRIPRIPVTWQGLLYFGGLLLIIFGAIGIAIAARERNVKEREEEKA